jgi:DNA-binding response OmpR family regulator
MPMTSKDSTSPICTLLARDSAKDDARKRILLVEDEIWIALDLERILVAAGYDVVRLAKEEMEALRLADATRPSLVLMDVRLRDGSDGIDAATKIYEKFGIRSIFLSAHLDERTRRRAATAHPYALIEKPFELPALLKEISAALPGT